MQSWRQELTYDPIPPLLAGDDDAVTYFVRRDLLHEAVGPISTIWELPEVQKILKKQRPDGSWKYPGKRDEACYPRHHYPLVETWKQFRFLIDTYELGRAHSAVENAAEFLFSCQTDAGDFRGFIGNQYATYYTGALMSLLIKAGYADDPRIEKGFQWLLSMRQDDGGWTVPILTADLPWNEQLRITSRYAAPIEPDRSQPFSHNWTGMIIRAFSAHPRYRGTEAARIAAQLLTSRFFRADVYNSYKAADYWVKFQYPFWWNNLVAALDAVSLIGLSSDDEQIRHALQWLKDAQQEAGDWKLSYARTPKPKPETAANKKTKLWVSLAICRVFQRLYT
jgi:hypothetical protein